MQWDARGILARSLHDPDGRWKEHYGCYVTQCGSRDSDWECGGVQVRHDSIETKVVSLKTAMA